MKAYGTLLLMVLFFGMYSCDDSNKKSEAEKAEAQALEYTIDSLEMANREVDSLNREIMENTMELDSLLTEIEK